MSNFYSSQNQGPSFVTIVCVLVFIVIVTGMLTERVCIIPATKTWEQEVLRCVQQVGHTCEKYEKQTETRNDEVQEHVYLGNECPQGFIEKK